jgi:hypothetical protein
MLPALQRSWDGVRVPLGAGTRIDRLSDRWAHLRDGTLVVIDKETDQPPFVHDRGDAWLCSFPAGRSGSQASG